MGELPAQPLAASPSIALSPALSSDAMADAVDAAEFLDVDMDQLAGRRTFVTPDRLDGIKVAHSAQPSCSEHAADGGGRDADTLCDMPAAQPLAAQSDDLRLDGSRGWTAQLVRPRRAVDEPVGAFRLEPFQPLARRPRADACGSCGGLRRLPASHRHNHPLSTKRRQSGILVNVHPVLRESLKLRQLQLPRLGPDGQPNETSQLAEA